MIDKKFIKFLFVGGLNTLFGYLMYVIFISTPLRRELALFCGYIVGVLWNFKTTGCIVFKNNDNKLVFKFIPAYIVTYFINLWALNYVHDHNWGGYLADFTLKMIHLEIEMNLAKYFDQIILVFPIAMISFTLMNVFVFKENREKKC